MRRGCWRRRGQLEERAVLGAFEFAQLGVPPGRDAGRLCGASVGVDGVEEEGAGDDLAPRVVPPALRLRAGAELGNLGVQLGSFALEVVES